ncbi:hypothetical protein JOB18_023255 [Solea senegalensis]|uniref:Nicolin 1 n=1 Tax=Solea senegalensis TaxID=28829 RepID=A0AAV6QR14_SOLSE|nr:hypothetical protein JOB18_023255 [Solea senegalensis]
MSGRCDQQRALTCTVKPALYLNMGERPCDAAQSGVCVVDVTLPFGKTADIEEITFQNDYTASVTVRLLRRRPGHEAPAQWCTALRDLSLMDNPHSEGGSQDYYSIHRSQMRAEPDDVASVRLILKQPSSAWLSFSLKNIEMFPHTEPHFLFVLQEPEKEVCDWLSDLTLDDHLTQPQDVPDPHTVSSSLQQMWALTEVMQSDQTTASVGRFDVDGCYDVDLISLT